MIMEHNSFSSAVKRLTTLAKFGDSRFWPYFLMKESEFELDLKCVVYYDLRGQDASCQEDLNSADITKAYDHLISGLRNHVQMLFNGLAQAEGDQVRSSPEYEKAENKRRADREAEIKKQRAGQEFLKNARPDYGDKTVAQIAEELGISKSEVRRRKQSGEL